MNSLDAMLSYLKLSPAEAIVIYILRHTDGNTKIFSRTYNEIQKATGASQNTIARTFKALEKNGTLKRAGYGKWYVPAIIGYHPGKNENAWSLEAATD